MSDDQSTCPHSLVNRARKLGETHRAAGRAPFGDGHAVVWEDGSALLMDALGVTTETINATVDIRVAACYAYADGLEPGTGIWDAHL